MMISSTPLSAEQSLTDLCDGKRCRLIPGKENVARRSHKENFDEG
jgi:hypothetical protein